MNHQGRRGQINCNANIQTQVSPPSTGALRRLRSSSSSFSAGSDQRFPDRFSGPNINLPLENNNAGVYLHEPRGPLGLSISSSNSLTRSPRRFPNRFLGPNVLHHQGTIPNIPQNIVDSSPENVECINLDLSLSLPRNPTASQNQSGNNSSTVNEINNGTHGSTSANTALLPSKRRATDSDTEFLAGESSSLGAQARMPKRLVPRASSHVNANNNVNTSPICIGPRNTHPRGFEGVISHHPSISVSEMHAAAAEESPQASVFTNIFSNADTRGIQALLNSSEPLFLPFFDSTESVGRGTSSYQPLEHAPPNFTRLLRGSPRITYMNPRNPLPETLFDYSQIENEYVEPFHELRNIQGNNWLGAQSARGNNIPVNFRFMDGTGNFLGNLPNSSERNGSFAGNANLSNEAERVPQFYMHEQEHPMQMVSATVGNLSDHQSSRSLEEMDPHIPISNNPTTGNQHGSVATSEIRAGGNAERPPRPLRTLAPRDPETRSNLAAQVQTAMEHFGTGHAIRIEDLLLLDYSVVLHMIEAEVAQREQNVEPGLPEEVIMKNIRHGNFKLVGEETPENKEACCICREEYLNGEEVGKLDCEHIFHTSCIKQWLMLRNVCPICKRKGITTSD